MASTSALRSYVLLHRHGHRSPAINLFTGDEALGESKLWHKLLVQESDHVEMSRMHPIVSPYHNSAERHDVKTHPYGCLTSKGRMHMLGIGNDLAKRHKYLKGVSAANTWVCSTNFQRTQASVQALLMGLGAKTDVSVFCRHADKCGLALYNKEGNVRTQQMLKAVQRTPEFLELEASPGIAAFRKTMLQEFPVLKNGYHGFNYFGAFDFFQCRDKHSLPLIPALQDPAVALAINTHMAARFRLYFTHAEHIAQFILPLLRDIRKSLFTRTNLLTVFSGHDVNVLGLIYGLGIDHLCPPNYWPDYGSTLLLEANKATNEIVVWAHELQDEPLATISIEQLDDIVRRHEANHHV
jgi:hypothetical protein